MVPDEVNVVFLLNLDDTKDVEELLYVKILLKDRRGPGSSPQPPESL